jgi:hypothetical protein
VHISTPVKQKDNLFEVVLNTVSDGVTVLDKDLRIKFQNKTITQVYGSRVGDHCYKAFRGRTGPCEGCVVLEVIEDGKNRRGIIDITLPNGDTLLLEVSSAAIKDEEGKIIGAVEVSRDVTEQKKAEAILNKTLLERNEVLKQLSNELSDATGYVKTVLPQPITSGPLLTDWRFIPSALLFYGSSNEQLKVNQLRTPNFVIGGQPDTAYQGKIQLISRPSRLYVFSDGVFDISKMDGTIWGFNAFLEFITKIFTVEHSILDRILSCAQELAQKEEFDDDFTILEIFFE